MGTHSILGYKNDGKEKTVYCHFDGHIENNGVYALALLKYSKDIFKMLIDTVNNHNDYLGSFGIIFDFDIKKNVSLLGLININFSRKDLQQNNTISFSCAKRYEYYYLVDFDSEKFTLGRAWQNKEVVLSFKDIDKLSFYDLDCILKSFDLDIDDCKLGVKRYYDYIENLNNSMLLDIEIFKQEILKSINVLNNCMNIEDAISEYALKEAI